MQLDFQNKALKRNSFPRDGVNVIFLEAFKVTFYKGASWFSFVFCFGGGVCGK